MPITTTPSVEGRKSARYCGVITGEAIPGANVFKDLFAGIRDIELVAWLKAEHGMGHGHANALVAWHQAQPR